jgi:hypothetical protein
LDELGADLAGAAFAAGDFAPDTGEAADFLDVAPLRAAETACIFLATDMDFLGENKCRYLSIA